MSTISVTGTAPLSLSSLQEPSAGISDPATVLADRAAAKAADAAAAKAAAKLEADQEAANKAAAIQVDQQTARDTRQQAIIADTKLQDVEKAVGAVDFST
jgi:hypothetical protein